jgi:parallel beta-helix repeat protein
MNKKITVLVLLFFAVAEIKAQGLRIKKGLALHKSSTIKKANYQIEGDKDIARPVITVEGNNIVIDFAGAVLDGSMQRQPDEFTGVAVLIKTGTNITIRNLKARGYKIGLMASGIDGLKLENCDFSYNYRQHLNSTQEKEDLSDWMSYHNNENDEWLRYGAGMYLKECTNAVVSGCRVTGGQNALMMMSCSFVQVFNNDFSFNSGIGLGMYRCTQNQVLYNRINFNVRGYSHGVYNRGQDSAGILVYEQSSNNLFYRNSVTHGGDGFFLWAGQTTMDTGQGGCNDNIIAGNDFSYAPTNGVEVTFSRNAIIQNRIFECDHGIWGGYSYQTDISGNQFRNNRIGIAIEHGQDNRIHHNLFLEDEEAIRLWSDRQQPSDWGYAKFRDTRSRGYILVGNSFNHNKTIFHISGTDSLKVFGNRMTFYDEVYRIDSEVTRLDTTIDEELNYTLSEELRLKDLPKINALDPFKGLGKWAGRKNIRMTEWGPYNFQYPLLWNTNPVDTSAIMEFEVLGPKGRYRLHSLKGVEMVSRSSDSLPSTFTVKKLSGDVTDIEIIASFTGNAYTDQFGRKIAAGQTTSFRFAKYFQPVRFSVSWFAFDSTTNPIRTDYLERIKTLRPLKVVSTDRLDYAWWGGIDVDGRKYAQFLTIADGNAEMAAGEYELGITWDDAVRVYVDGRRLVDEWNPSLYKFDESPNKKVRVNLAQGWHQFRVEHVELGGFATLSLKIKKVN